MGQRSRSLFDGGTAAGKHWPRSASSNTHVSDCFLLLLPHFAATQNNTRAATEAFVAASMKQHNGKKNHAPLLAQAAVAFNGGNMARAHQL